MKIIKTASEIPHDTVITIGKFEGLHKGHKHLIQTVICQAKAHGLASCLISFVPHPIKVLADSDYKPLFTREEQARLLETTGIDCWFPFPFDRDFAKTTPKDFCDFLYTKLRCRVLVIGKNFRFGHNRAGTPETLSVWGQAAGVSVVTVPPIENGVAAPISTSSIRYALETGETEKAARLLGQPFFIMGKVEEGAKLGRTLGFPTVNLHPDAQKFLPKAGVYLTTTYIGTQPHTSLTNLGNNPTINATAPTKAETHILNFDGDLYNQEVLIEFNKFLRPQQAFASVEELKAQIRDDVRSVSTQNPYQ